MSKWEVQKCGSLSSGERVSFWGIPRAQEVQISFGVSRAPVRVTTPGLFYIQKSLTRHWVSPHFPSTAPQTCLAVSNPEAAGPLIPQVMDWLCHWNVVLLGLAHPGQKQTSGHKGWSDGLGKERKHLGLSFSISSTEHSLGPICWPKSVWESTNMNQPYHNWAYRLDFSASDCLGRALNGH